jgi:hypothetical protein
MRLAAVLVLLVWAAPAAAESQKCGALDALLSKVNEGADAAGDLWRSDRAFLLPARGAPDNKQALVFSFASRLTIGDLARLLHSDPSALQEFRSLEESAGLSVPQRRPEYARGRSHSDLALRFSDLSPEEFHRRFNEDAFGAGASDAQRAAFYRVAQGLKPVIQKAFARRGLAVEARFDGQNVKIEHESWESRPAQFARGITEGIHGVATRAETSLRMSLPALAVDDRQASAIARAVETRLILKMAEQPKTSLRRLPRVGLNLNHERLPVPAHSLELPAGAGDEGLRQIGFAAALAARASDLVQVDSAANGSLGGALSYAATALAQSPLAHRRELGTALARMGAEVEQTGLTPSKRAEIARFLVENEIERYLGPDAFFLRK